MFGCGYVVSVCENGLVGVCFVCVFVVEAADYLPQFSGVCFMGDCGECVFPFLLFGCPDGGVNFCV